MGDICFVGVSIFLLAIFIIIKEKFLNFPEGKRKANVVCKKYDIGNAQLLGKREMQNDYFSVLEEKNALLCVLANGVSDHIEGRYSAVAAVETLKQGFRKKEKGQTYLKFFKYAFGDVSYILAQRDFSHSTGATVIAAVFHKDKIHWAAVGDCELFLLRKKRLLKLTDNISFTYREEKWKRQDVYLLHIF